MGGLICVPSLVYRSDTLIDAATVVISLIDSDVIDFIEVDTNI